MPGMGMHDGWFGWWPLGGLIWLLVIGLAIFGLVAIVRGRPGQRDKSEASFWRP